MKTGQRKLCDVHAHDGLAQADVETRLAKAAIPFETYGHSRSTGAADFWDRDFVRYAVHVRDLREAQALLPLTLRGFRVVAEGGGK